MGRGEGEMELTKQERRWVLAGATILILLYGVPALWAFLSPPAGFQFYRTWTYGEDYTQYRSAMAQGHAGSWLVLNRFTPEPHEPVMQYPLYVLLGHAARLLHLPLEVPFVIASALAIVCLASAIYAFAAAFHSNQRQRRLSFMLVLAIGPDWLLRVIRVLAPRVTWLARYDQAFNRPEVATLYLFNTAPHLAFALAILLFIVAFDYRRQLSPERFTVTRLALYYVALPLILGLLNPFSLPTLVLPLGIWWVVRSCRARRLLVKEALPLVVMVLATLPVLAYNWWSFTQDPFWGRTYGGQNIQYSFPPDMVLLGYGLVGLLAIAGAVQACRKSQRPCMLALWALVVLLLGYLPVTYQRRFSLGLAPALAVLAATGWQWVAETVPGLWLRRRAVTRIIGSTVLVLLLWGQSLFFYIDQTRSFAGLGSMSRIVFQPESLADAVSVVDAWGENAVVLTCEELGNLLAGEIRGRVVLGHSGATLNVADRREEVSKFFADTLSQEGRDRLLQRYRVTHMVTSTVEPYECGNNYVPPAAWSLDFDQGGIQVWGHVP
jgi:hypothetical protein